MKFILLIYLALTVHGTTAQTIKHATVGSMGGQFVNGSVMLNYTLGETMAGLQLTQGTGIKTGYWNVVSAGFTASAIGIFRFTGDGNFSSAFNWQSGAAPPNPLPANSEIIIAPIANGSCLLDIPYTLSPGSKLTVLQGKQFLIKGGLKINQL